MEVPAIMFVWAIRQRVQRAQNQQQLLWKRRKRHTTSAIAVTLW
jgi:hypothetical protein